MDAREGWALRAPLLGRRAGMEEHPVTTRFLLGLPLVHKGRAMLPDAERSWEFRCYSKRAYLTAFEELRLPEPSAILDIGCSDGFLTCFYGRPFPRARIVGLDRSADAVALARKLATILNLDNVTFVVGEARDLDAVLEGRAFGLVISSCVFSRYVNGEGRQPDRPPDVEAVAKGAEIVAAIRRVLAPRGLFVSTEGWKTAPELRRWGDLVGSLGFAIDWGWSRSCRLGVPSDRVLWSMLVAHACSGTTTASLEQAEAFLVRADSEGEDTPPAIHGHAAEALFKQLSARRLYALRVTCPNGSTWQRELYEVGPLVISYEHTNGGDRELMFWPRWSLVSLVSTLESEAENLMANEWDVVVHRVEAQ